MTNKLHTSKKTQEIFVALGKSVSLQPYILSKLAIALSVRKGQLQPDDYETDNEAKSFLAITICYLNLSLSIMRGKWSERMTTFQVW